MPTDLEIAQAAQPKRIQEIAEKAGIPEGAISPYGQYIAKVDPMQLGVGSEMRAFSSPPSTRPPRARAKRPFPSAWRTA